MPSAKINNDALRRMWMAGLSSKEIAASFGVQYPAVNRAADRLGLPKRSRDGLVVGSAKSEPKPTKEKDVFSDFGKCIMTDLARVKTYAELAEVASMHGVSISRAQSLWHRVR